MNKKPKILILRADGINRDVELAYAFTIAGGDAKIVHVNELRSKNESLKNYKILALPGGFAYGDDVASGKILAVELTSFLSEELRKFVTRTDTAVFGVCNGFQALVRTGLVPFRTIGNMQTTLMANASGHFECRWIRLRVEENSSSVLLDGMKGKIVSYPVAHGEGRFFADKKTLDDIEKKKLVVFRYVDEGGKPTQHYPENPNGAISAIAGITDTTGRILGLMPHPECFTRLEQHPNWRRGAVAYPHGLPFFESMVSFVKNA